MHKVYIVRTEEYTFKSITLKFCRFYMLAKFIPCLLFQAHKIPILIKFSICICSLKLLSLEVLVFFNLPTASTTRVSVFCIHSWFHFLPCINTCHIFFHLYIITGLIQYCISPGTELRCFITLQIFYLCIYRRWIIVQYSGIIIWPWEADSSNLFFRNEFSIS
jgi:hypothetical protein